MKMLYTEIVEVQNALQLFTQHSSKAWYGMSRNLDIAKRGLKSSNSRLDETRKKFCICDKTSGNPIIHALTKDGEVVPYKQSELPIYVIDQQRGPNLQLKCNSDEAEKDLNATVKQIELEAIDVEWFKIPINQIGEISLQGDYSALVGTIIVDEPIKFKEEKKKK